MTIIEQASSTKTNQNQSFQNQPIDELKLRGKMANGIAICHLADKLASPTQKLIAILAIATLAGLAATIAAATSTLPIIVPIAAGVVTLWLVCTTITATVLPSLLQFVKSREPCYQAGIKGDYKEAEKLLLSIKPNSMALVNTLHDGDLGPVGQSKLWNELLNGVRHHEFVNHPDNFANYVTSEMGGTVEKMPEVKNVGALLLYHTIQELRESDNEEAKINIFLHFPLVQMITKESVGEYAHTQLEEMLQSSNAVKVAKEFDDSELEALKKSIFVEQKVEASQPAEAAAGAAAAAAAA